MRLQITAGRGPIEVQAFVVELVAHLEACIRASGGAVERLATSSGSVQLEVLGASFDDWLGTHELVDPVRGRGRRRRWYCAVRALPTPAKRPRFRVRDVQIHACRAGGPGGQHVNTTSSAVRAVHRPTGRSVRVASERCQHRNRAEALRLLAEELEQARERARSVDAREVWSHHDEVVRGAPTKRWVRRRGVLREL